MEIKVGFCVAYDWLYLENSLRSIYDHADKICLSIDEDRISWTGQNFSFDNKGFFELVRNIDIQKKIIIYEADFHITSLSPMENEVRQRNLIAEVLGKESGWHIQLDTDEYFLRFEAFVQFLKNFKSKKKVNICCPMLNLYKQLPEGMLWIKPEYFSQIQYFPIATLFPKYEHGRLNGYFNFLTNHPILHQSWARNEGEIWEKLTNWGHANDFDVEKEFLRWKNLNISNYKEYIDFHFLHPKTWPCLELQQRFTKVSDAISMKEEYFPLPINKWDLHKSNSIWLSRAKKIVGKIRG